MKREPLMEIRGLDIAFGRGKRQVQCTDQVSLQVAPGEILCLVGESGCGKSITALAVMGLLPRQGRVTGGSIRLMGRELPGLSEKELDQVRGRDRCCHSGARPWSWSHKRSLVVPPKD